jgi:hypothetical protein
MEKGSLCLVNPRRLLACQVPKLANVELSWRRPSMLKEFLPGTLPRSPDFRGPPKMPDVGVEPLTKRDLWHGRTFRQNQPGRDAVLGGGKPWVRAGVDERKKGLPV